MTGFLMLSGASLVAWLVLLLGRGFFWRCDQRLGDIPSRGSAWPPVAVIIPARNERPTIGAAVRSALDQDYPGPYRVIVVDDHSEDGTAIEAERAAGQSERFRLVTAAPLADGWTGKLWAQQNGLAEVARWDPATAYILFTDADIVHPPTLVRRLVAKAIGEGRALVSLMVTLSCATAVERLLVPAFIFFFQKLYPFRWVNDAARGAAAAAGGCLLVDRAHLEASGGIAAIRGHLIDDCALARRIKARAPIWLGLSATSCSLRRYEDLGTFWRMVARTAFTQLDHSWALLAVTVLAMTALYIVPPLAVAAGIVSGSLPLALLGGAAMMLMLVAYIPTLRLYHLPWAWALTLPAAAALYVLMTLDSARLSWLGRGGAWKGRTFSMPTMPPGRK